MNWRDSARKYPVLLQNLGMLPLFFFLALRLENPTNVVMTVEFIVQLNILLTCWDPLTKPNQGMAPSPHPPSTLQKCREIYQIPLWLPSLVTVNLQLRSFTAVVQVDSSIQVLHPGESAEIMKCYQITHVQLEETKWWCVKEVLIHFKGGISVIIITESWHGRRKGVLVHPFERFTCFPRHILQLLDQHILCSHRIQVSYKWHEKHIYKIVLLNLLQFPGCDWQSQSRLWSHLGWCGDERRHRTLCTASPCFLLLESLHFRA